MKTLALTYLIATAIVGGAVIHGKGNAKGWVPFLSMCAAVLSGGALAFGVLL